MLVTRRIQVQIEDEIGKYTPIAGEWKPYNGPVDLAKKGRETVEQNASIGQGQAKTNNANSNAAYGKAQGLLGEDIGSSTPGSLTPAASAQLASDNDNINRVYNGMRQQAFQTLGQRGFNNAPSGFTTASMNGIAQGEGNAETGAYRNAQQNTQAQRNFATTGEENLAGQQGNLGTANIGQSTTAAVDRSKMGSTLGDVAQGIGDAASIAGSIMVPGSGALFNSIGKPFTMGQDLPK